MCTRCAFIAGLASVAATPSFALARTGDPGYLEIAMPRMQRVADTVWLGRLTRNVWVHTTTKILDGDTAYFPANGAIVVDGDSALLIDTGWNTRQTTQLLEAWKSRSPIPITRGLVTHFHMDRLGGIPVLAANGIPAYGNPLTIGLAIDNGYAPPKPLHELEKKPVAIGNVEVFYPGEGHTVDNIVAWVRNDGVLFGGCLVKSTTAHGLGNLADANVPAWPATAKLLVRRYAGAKHVIPGHGTISGDPLAKTLELAIAGKS